MAAPTTGRGPLSERYRPQRLDDVVGSARSRAEIRAWATEWNGPRPPSRRALLLSGPPGVGKTTTALAIASEFGWTLVEMNASDARNEAAIERVAGRASITHTLTEHRPGAERSHALILLDEADCLTGKRSETARPAPAPVTLREFLRGRYGTIEALNRAWELGTPGHPAPFDEWEALPRSAGRAAWTRLAPALRDLADWKGGTRPTDFSDRGGLGAVARLVRATRQPLVITVNDEQVLTRYSPVFRTALVRVRFGPIRDADLSRHVLRIAELEGIRLDPGAVPAIVRKARGDLRAALNDLEAIAPLPPGPAQLSVLGLRDLTSDLTLLTEEALTAHRYYRSFEVRDRLDAPPDDLFPWIDENIAVFAPDATHRADAYRVLGHADLLLQRARRARVWGLWTYASELLTGGVGLAIRDAPVPVREGARFPEFLGAMGQSRNARALREGVVAKGAHRLHLSKRKTRLMVLPFLEELIGGGGAPHAPPKLADTAQRLVRELELTAEEVAYLLGVPPESPAVAMLLKEEIEPEAPDRTADSSGPGSGGPTASSEDEPVSRKRQRSLSEFGS